MANTTLIQYPSGQTQYRIPFDYLSRTFIYLTLVNSLDQNQNKVLAPGRDFRFLNDTTVEILIDQSGFDVVRMFRQTSTGLVVNFQDGSVLTAKDLTNAEIQAIHIAEEGRDQTAELAKVYSDAALVSATNAKNSENAASKSASDTAALFARGLFGFEMLDSFQKGATVNLRNQAVRDEDTNEFYRWDGALPKSVPAGSNPVSTGGIGPGAWIGVGDATLRWALQSDTSGNGDELIAVKQPLASAVRRSLHERIADEVNVKDFGARGNNTGDDTAAIRAACSELQAAVLADGKQRTLIIPDGQYKTSDTIVVYPNIRLQCRGHVIFQNATGNKTFPAFELQGNGRHTVLGIIDNYGAGFVMRGNTQYVEFNTISNCIDGFIIRADKDWPATRNNLDNRVSGTQIGKCVNAIVFEQNADGLVQQGNEVRVNFVSETNNSAVFRTYGGFTHTKQSNWDSNYIELVASDPLTLPDSSMVRNTTPFQVPNLTFKVTGWCGGWERDAGTICLIRGQFSACNFMFNLAAGIGLNEVVDSTSRASFGSCSVDLCRHSNLGSGTSFYTGVSPNSSFNNGVAVQNDKFRVRITVPDLAPGQVFGSSFWHVLVQRSDTSRARLEQVAGAAQARNGLLVELADSGTERQGMVRVWVRNIGSATVTTRDIDIIVSMS